MKGLIFKDFMCLRKNLQTFGLVSLGALILGIMFLLSSQYGNLAAELAQIEQDAEMEGLLTMQAMKSGIWVVVILPIGFITEIHFCFKEDARVGFYKVVSGVALSPYQIVGSRYLTTLIYSGLGVFVALISALFVSLVPVDMEMGNLFIGIITVVSIVLLYMSFYLFMVYFCGIRGADLIQMAPLVLMIVVIGVFMSKWNGMTDEEMTCLLLDWGDKLMWFFQNGYKILVPLSVVAMFASYMGSVAAIKRKRRVL